MAAAVYPPSPFGVLGTIWRLIIVMYIMKIMHRIITALLLVFSISVAAAEKADRVVVEKSNMSLSLYRGGKLLATYPVVLGGNPKGHKEQEGDEKTPEGSYILDFKKSDSAFYKAIHISYPNADDIKNAQALSISPGDSIMIHGQKNYFGWASFISQRFNWTNGCVALTNKDMDAVWESVDAGTPIQIVP